MVDEKYEFLKSWCFTLIWMIFSSFLVLHWQLGCGIISKKTFLVLAFTYLEKETNISKAKSLSGGFQT